MATYLLETWGECVAACELIVKQISTEAIPAIAVDLEGPLGYLGCVDLVQVATRRGIFLFDTVRSGPNHALDGPLRQLLEDESVVKVMHSANSDTLTLQARHGVSLSNVFDTSAADVILRGTGGNPRGLGKVVTSPQFLNRVCSFVLIDASKGRLKVNWLQQK